MSTPLPPPAPQAPVAPPTPSEAVLLAAALPGVVEALLRALRSEQGYATITIPVESGAIKRPLVHVTLRV